MSGALQGKRIVVTRARHQAADLGARLEALGADVVYCPALRIAAPADARPFQQAVEGIGSYEWLILTSTNGVDALQTELNRQGKQSGDLRALRVACVGPATAAAVERIGLVAATVPHEFVGREIAAVLASSIRPGTRVLVVRGAGGDAELPLRLRSLGAEVNDVEAYRSEPDLGNVAIVRKLLDDQEVEMITFTSPSSATYFVNAVGKLPERVRLAAIGPITAERLRAIGLNPAIVASEHTAAGLVAAIVQYYDASESRSYDRE